MPRPRPRARERRAEFKPFTETDGRIGQQVHGHDFYRSGYGEPPDFFDRERMEQDWREYSDEICELAKIAFPHYTRPYWSEKEFDATS